LGDTHLSTAKRGIRSKAKTEEGAKNKGINGKTGLQRLNREEISEGGEGGGGTGGITGGIGRKNSTDGQSFEKGATGCWSHTYRR